jgi:hypothetical protein
VFFAIGEGRTLNLEPFQPEIGSAPLATSRNIPSRNIKYPQIYTGRFEKGNQLIENKSRASLSPNPQTHKGSESLRVWYSR